jgi:hypothetical protein
MSFDIFLQRFDDVPADDAAIDALVERAATSIEREGTSRRVATEDGGAEIYGDARDGLMFTNASGEVVFDLIVEVARAAGWVILPGDCGTVVVGKPDPASLPDFLPEPVVEITTGSELIAHIEATP